MPDVVNEVSGRDSFRVVLEYDESMYEWAFRGERHDLSMMVKEVMLNFRGMKAPQELRYLLPPLWTAANQPKKKDDLDFALDENEKRSVKSLVRHLRNLTYITAERIAPQEVYVLEDPHVVSTVGPQGEHAVSVLHWGRDESVLDELALPESLPPSAAAGRRTHAHIFSKLPPRYTADPTNKRRDVGIAHLGRHGISQPSPHGVWPDPDSSHRGSRSICGPRRHHIDREPGGPPSSGWPSTDGTVYG